MIDLDEFFSRMADHAAAPAVDDGTRVVSYQQLGQQVGAWTDRLDALPAERVAYRLGNGIDWIALDLALLLSGRVAVPIPDFFAPAQVRHVLDVTGVDTLVKAAAEPIAEGFRVDHQTTRWAICTRRPSLRPALHSGTAKVTFTSGSTGTPKGVCLSAASLLATAGAVASALGDAGIARHLCVLPLSLLLENVAGVYANLLHGSTVCVPALAQVGLTGSSGLDVAAFMAAQTRWRPDSMILVPQLLLALTAAAEFGMPIPDSYRFVAVGGGKVAISLIERAAAVGIPAFEGYGLTECGSVVTLNLPDANRPGSVGRPLPGFTVQAVDGELQVRGGGMLGYLGGRTVRPPIATGDLGHLDADGFVHVTGRRKNGFITAFGRNVSPEWVECELQTELAVAHAVVFGESLPANVALLVARAGAEPDAVSRAVAAANQRLPDYARIADWRLLDRDDFVRSGCLTDNGRLRRGAIVERFQSELEALFSSVNGATHDAIRQA